MHTKNTMPMQNDMPKRATPPLRSAMTFAALSILLAACGGGGGNDNNTTSSGSRTPTATAGSNAAASSSASATTAISINTGNGGTAATTPTAGSGSTQNGNAAPATPTARESASDTQTATNTAPAGPAPAISDTGVRGDVLLAMMEQHGCGRSPNEIMKEADYRTDFSRAPSLEAERMNINDEDTPPVIGGSAFAFENYTYDMSYWQRPGVVRPETAPMYVWYCNDNVRTYSIPTSPGTYPYTVSSEARYLWARIQHWNDEKIVRGFNGQKAIFNVTITENEVLFGGTAQVEQQQDIGNRARNHERFLPSTTYQAEFKGEGFSFRRQGLVSFGTLRQWQDSAGNTVRLMLLVGNAADEARLCLDSNSALVKRLQCERYRVPADWAWGKELPRSGAYIVDDRSVHAGETGFMYWK